MTYQDFINAEVNPDEKWAQIYRNRFNVAQRKFATSYPGYTIKRYLKQEQGVATWRGHVFHEKEEESIGNFHFRVYKTKNGLAVEIAWLGRLAGRDHKGNRIADWNNERTNHRGVMTGIVKLFMEQVKDDIEYVILDDGSGGYWEYFFNKYYPRVKVHLY